MADYGGRDRMIDDMIILSAVHRDPYCETPATFTVCTNHINELVTRNADPLRQSYIMFDCDGRSLGDPNMD